MSINSNNKQIKMFTGTITGGKQYVVGHLAANGGNNHIGSIDNYFLPQVLTVA